MNKRKKNQLPKAPQERPEVHPLAPTVLSNNPPRARAGTAYPGRLRRLSRLLPSQVRPPHHQGSEPNRAAAKAAPLVKHLRHPRPLHRPRALAHRRPRNRAPAHAQQRQAPPNPDNQDNQASPLWELNPDNNPPRPALSLVPASTRALRAAPAHRNPASRQPQPISR